MQAAKEEMAEMGNKKVLIALGISVATFYRRQKKPSIKTGRARSARALSEQEQQHVLDVLHSQRFMDDSPAEVYATLLEEDTYLCSERTMYRLLEANAEVRERRAQLQHPAYHKPELIAQGPHEVWSWDITKLKTTVKFVYFYLYVILDIFSRYVVGWMLAEHENGTLARRLVQETCERYEIQPGQLVLHADRGSPMKSKALVQLLVDLDIYRSHSRPHVCDDNPFSESQFKTLKYHPGFPDQLGCLAEGLAYFREFFPWYNQEHHHSALCYLTPGQVHFGQDKQVLEQRHRTQLAAYERHPERFIRGAPKLQQLANAVWINPPRAAVGDESSPLQMSAMASNKDHLMPLSTNPRRGAPGLSPKGSAPEAESLGNGASGARGRPPELESSTPWFTELSRNPVGSADTRLRPIVLL